MCINCSKSKPNVQATKTSGGLPHRPPINNSTPPFASTSKANGDDFPTPIFTEEFVQQGRCDGYWIEPILLDPTDKCPSLVANGLHSGDITVFINPVNEWNATPFPAPGDHSGKDCAPTKPNEGAKWIQITVGVFDTPLIVQTADVAGNGRQDLVLCHQYGQRLWDADKTGGHLVWLENPGKEEIKKGKQWTKRYIGRWPLMHRLKVGYFTQSSYLQVVGLPVTAGSNDFATPIPVLLFTRPEKVLDVGEWPFEVIDDENYHLIHDAAKHRFHSKSQGGRESFFMASQEGVHWMNFTRHPPKWNAKLIGHGVSASFGRHGLAGVEMGKIPGDDAAYIMAVGPFYGDSLYAYTKRGTDPESVEWVEHLIDIYGTPEQKNPIQKPPEIGTRPFHFVATADFDGDGVDECVVTLMGPDPAGKGIYYYKPVDLANGIFAKWRISDVSASKIAVADFSGNGTLDIAAISYNVPHYYEEPNPSIRVYYNQFATLPETDPQTISTIWAGEPLLYFPKPTSVKKLQSIPLIEVGGYRVTFEIYPPNMSSIGFGDASQVIRVLWGEISSQDDSDVRRVVRVAPYQKASAVIGKSMKTGSEGVVLVRFESFMNDSVRAEWKDNTAVPVTALFEPTYSALSLPDGSLVFNRYASPPKRDFWNLTGFHFRFLDTKANLAHMQFWAARKGVNGGLHNHSNATFIELHLCLFAGTGNGGMWHVLPGVEVNPASPDDTNDPKDFIQLPLNSLEEHGPFWKMDCNNKPKRRENWSIDYPWHKWQAGDKDDGLDIWAAFEYNPEFYEAYYD